MEFTRPEGATDYVNSMWQIQDAPFGGDVVNSYNDGPPAPGAKPLGPFYELETSSPAAALAPGASLVHRHRTLHIVGANSALDGVARKVLGVGLAEIAGPSRGPRVTRPGLALVGLLVAAAPSGATAEDQPERLDPFGLLERKDFVARRASSNHPDPSSNDDSKQPIPGETTVLADLQGPGIVTHIWITVADSEYGWPRLLRLRVYYDGSTVPSVDAPLGDFFAVGHGFERPVQSLMIRDSSDGPLAQQLLADALPEVLPHHGDQRGPPARRTTSTTRWTGRSCRRRRRHALLPRPLPAGPADLGRQALRDPLTRRGRGHYVGTVMSVVQAEAGWFGEGDDLFYVDGEKAASLEGTGTEDYFNDAWSLHVSEGLYTGRPGRRRHGAGRAHERVPLAPHRPRPVYASPSAS